MGPPLTQLKQLMFKLTGVFLASSHCCDYFSNSSKGSSSGCQSSTTSVVEVVMVSDVYLALPVSQALDLLHFISDVPTRVS